MVHQIPKVHYCEHAQKKLELPLLPPVRGTTTVKITDGSTVDSISDVTHAVNDNFVHKIKKYWDEYLISLMSPSTAQYIAFEASQNDTQAARLQDLVQNWYGTAPPYCELVPDDVEDTTSDSRKDDIRSKFPYQYYMDIVQNMRLNAPIKETKTLPTDATTKQRIADLLSRDIGVHEEDQQTDPYGDDTKASFYRLPGLLRRQKKATEIFEKDSGNKTAENLHNYVLPTTPPRRLDTVLNSKIGDKVIMSDNQFVQDLLICTKNEQKKLLNESDDVVMVQDKRYKKCLQPVWPTTITSKLPSEEDLNSFSATKCQLVKGHNRWIDFPVKEETNLRSTEEISYAEEQTRLESRKRVRDHTSVNLIVDQWRKKWQLTQKYNDSTVEALLKDMADPHPTIRMQAIVTVAKSASRVQASSEEGTGAQSRNGTVRSDVIPDVLLESIGVLLEDNHHQVKKAAAVAMHSLERQTDLSLKILRNMLSSGSTVDRWTAAQCLALSGVSDSHVIGELVDQLMTSEDILVHEKASKLLAHISLNTKLAHGMLGEKLNTVSWRQRIIICKTLPLLHGSLNKDILRKLIYLMWQDPHKEVKIAASQAIGKMGHGKTVHDELIKKLEHSSEIVRSDALEKIGILKVMTTRMMPGFLKCFTDDFVIVRKEVCRTCYRLAIQDEVCVRNMLTIARYDPSFQVKVYAIRALSKVSVESAETRSCFIWALQYEAEVRVRYEALHSLLDSVKLDKEIVDILMSRFLVEDDRNIVKLLRKSLRSVGIDPDEDIDTVAEVKAEVRRFLADKNHITELILVNEAEEDYLLQRELMIASSDEDSPAFLNNDNDLAEEENSKKHRVFFADEMMLENDGGESIAQHGSRQTSGLTEDWRHIESASDEGKETFLYDAEIVGVSEGGCDQFDGMEMGANEDYRISNGKEEILENEIEEAAEIVNDEVLENQEKENKGVIRRQEEELKCKRDIFEETKETENDGSYGPEDKVIGEIEEYNEVVEDNIVKERVEDDSSKETVEEDSLKDMEEDDFVNERGEYNPAKKRIEDDSNKEREEDDSIKEREEDDSIKEREEDDLVGESVKDDSVKERGEDDSIKERVEDDSLKERREDDSAKEIIKDDSIKERDEDELVDENVKDDSVKERGEDDFMNERIEDESAMKRVGDDLEKETGPHVHSQEQLDEERLQRIQGETSSLYHCSYKLPADSSYIKVFSPERSITWMTLATPIITTDPTQLDMLESTISSSIREMVNEAIAFEGIDCRSND